MERRRVSYSGSVQGVGFRATTRSVAARFAVSGWVRNQPDGRVQLEAQGDPAELDRFLAAVRDHLSRHIRHESADPIPAVEDETGFAIAR